MDFGMQFGVTREVGTAYYEIMLGRMNAQYNKTRSYGKARNIK